MDAQLLQQFGPQINEVMGQFLEEHGRPIVQEKVTEEVEETKVDLKRDLPNHINEYTQSDDANKNVKQVAEVMGDKFTDKVKSFTHHTVDIASEGMDLLLTGGVMNIAKDILKKATEGKGMSELEAIKTDKENMIKHTMAAAVPIIKQVSHNIGTKIKEHLPASIGGHVQEWIDEHGGDHSLVGFAAGIMGKIMGGDSHDSDDDDTPDQKAAKKAALEKAGIRTGKMQRIITSILGPKIADFIIPHMQRFEEKMHSKLEGELRNKIFSIDYIKQKALSLLAGSGGLGGLGGLLGKVLKIDDGKDDDHKEGGSGSSGSSAAAMGAVSALLNKKGGGGDGDDLNKVLGGLASKFLGHRED
ncbi:hypothetical protein B0O80DRAFT_450866 [Mortierella sp. GBAus27b]|nr:hypothetical protein BGX31_003240 [Mortierella sp. GBA43]KAI8354356.1 hypothetical protein B0O80DRAFT_450866 [Mortierella sp. GBAus27b]